MSKVIWADSDNGSTPALHAGSWGSIPHRSTKSVAVLSATNESSEKPGSAVLGPNNGAGLWVAGDPCKIAVQRVRFPPVPPTDVSAASLNKTGHHLEEMHGVLTCA